MKARGMILALGLLCLFCQAASSSSTTKTETATFAGGCFWCMEPPFLKLNGVLEVTSGYIGGTKPNPSYEEVGSGTSGYAEAVQVVFDPKKITYAQLLDAFWRSHDPTDPDGQFVDRGPQYRSAIWFHSPEQKKLAEKSKEKLDKSGRFPKKIITPILPATKFYPAEDYHQHFFQKNPARYHEYRSLSGRDQFIEKYWGKQEPH